MGQMCSKMVSKIFIHEEKEVDEHFRWQSTHLTWSHVTFYSKRYIGNEGTRFETIEAEWNRKQWRGRDEIFKKRLASLLWKWKSHIERCRDRGREYTGCYKIAVEKITNKNFSVLVRFFCNDTSYYWCIWYF